MTYRIRRYMKKYKRYVYVLVLDKYKYVHWTDNSNEANIYFDKNEAEADIKKYKLKGVEIYEEE